MQRVCRHSFPEGETFYKRIPKISKPCGNMSVNSANVQYACLYPTTEWIIRFGRFVCLNTWNNSETYRKLWKDFDSLFTVNTLLAWDKDRDFSVFISVKIRYPFAEINDN